MPRNLTSQMLAQTLAAVSMPVAFIEVDTPAGNVYFWTGFGEIAWNGKTWTGSGLFLNFSSIAETVHVQASGASFSLSGVPQSLISLVLQSLRRYFPIKLWIGALDATLAVIPDPYLVWDGLVDTGSIKSGGSTATITVTSENRLIALTTPKERRYTDQDQRIEHPTDGGFKFVEFLVNAIITWGKN